MQLLLNGIATAEALRVGVVLVVTAGEVLIELAVDPDKVVDVAVNCSAEVVTGLGPLALSNRLKSMEPSAFCKELLNYSINFSCHLTFRPLDFWQNPVSLIVLRHTPARVVSVI